MWVILKKEEKFILISINNLSRVVPTDRRLTVCTHYCYHVSFRGKLYTTTEVIVYHKLKHTVFFYTIDFIQVGNNN